MYIYFKNGERNNVEKNTLALMFLALVYFVAISCIDAFKDTSVIKEVLTGIIILFACFYFVHCYHKNYGERFVARLFIDLNKVGILHSAVVIATFVSSDFKYFLYDFISVTDKSMRYLFGEVEHERYQGIVVSGFSFLSATHALLLVLGVWGFYMNNKRYRLGDIFLFCLGQLMIFVSIGLIGRTGFVVLLVFLIALFILRAYNFIKDFRLSTKTIKLVFAFLILSIAMLFTVDISRYSKNINYAFETAICYIESRELDRSSTYILQHHFIFPDSTFDILFGTGNFGRSSNLAYIPSDVGYALFIHGAGIFGMFVGYGFYFLGLYYGYKYRQLNSYLSAFIAVYFFALMILNLKDYYYISYAGYSQIYFIALCALGKCVECRNDINMKLSRMSNARTP